MEEQEEDEVESAAALALARLAQEQLWRVGGRIEGYYSLPQRQRFALTNVVL